MNVIVYYRTRPSEPEASDAALVKQRLDVEAWIAKQDASVVGEFVEAETDSKARPRFGAALKACKLQDAMLLVAMPEPIGTGASFWPHDTSTIRVEIIEPPRPDPAPPAPRPAETPVVVYYRIRPGEAGESELALAGQKQDVAKYLRLNNAKAVAEHIEDEDTLTARPALAAAIADCQARNTILVIARTAPIGSGEPFEPPIDGVTIAFAADPDRPIPGIIPLPDKAPDRPQLYCSSLGPEEIAIYLANSSDAPLTAATVGSMGMMGDIQTTTAHKAIGTIPPRSCARIDTYDPMWDGDFTTVYWIAFTGEDGVRQRLDGTIPNGGPTSRWLALRPSATAAPATNP